MKQEQSFLEYSKWLSGNKGKNEYSSMWKNLILDFSDTKNETSYIFTADLNRGYNFVSNESISIYKKITLVFYQLNFILSKILNVLAMRCWAKNINNMKYFPIAKRLLSKDSSYARYLKFCEKYNLIIDNSNGLKSFYCSTIATSYLENNSRVLEIGGGTGCLSAFINFEKKISHYVIIDLPEMILVSATTLKTLYPDIEQHFIYPGSSAEIDQGKKGFFFVTIQCVDKIPVNFFDLVLNIDSFQEMTEKQVHDYINLAQSVLKSNGIFLNINRRKMLHHEKYDNNPLTYPYFRENEVLKWEIDPFFCRVLNYDQSRIDSWIKRVERVVK